MPSSQQHNFTISDIFGTIWRCRVAVRGVESFGTTLALGVVLGVAGASFAIALPLASYWYPPQHQGTALGIAGAGNSGTVLAALFAPRWRSPSAGRTCSASPSSRSPSCSSLFILLAKDSPTLAAAQVARGLRRDPAASRDAWWLMVFYSVTFGGFVGLSSFLPIYFNDQYGLSPVIAGYCTAACVFAGSFVRPFGGAVADRIGGVRALSFVYGLVAVLLADRQPRHRRSALALPLIIVTMGALGAGNGAVFQIVPQRFARKSASSPASSARPAASAASIWPPASATPSN